MIDRLSIINYAIIDNLEIDFTTGLTTITGETGAGKSIILGALNLLLGNRFDSVNFKDKSKKSIIEAIFNVSHLKLQSFFLDNDIDNDSILIIRREFSFEGKSRSFINDTPVKLDLLKNLSLYLIDIHSQHENLLINNENFQINLIDKFAENTLPQFSQIFSNFQSLFKDLNTLILNLDSKKRRLSHTTLDIEFQRKIIFEVDNLNLELGEKEILDADYKKLNNIHLIKQNLSESLFLCEDSESAIRINLNSVISKLSDISEYDTEVNNLLNRLKQNAIDINDIVMDIHTINHNLNLDSNQLSFIEDRINSINILEKKLNVSTIEEIQSKTQLMKDELASLDLIESEISQLEKDKVSIENKLFALADELTLLRKRSAFDLIDLLKTDLSHLGIDNPNIEFTFLKTDNLLHTGNDKIDLLFSSNKGYDPKPLVNVASGGEISRLMLCVKKNLFSISSFSTIIFDEIDSGVSGEIGRKMGRILQNISTQGQVICITHLPQIASLGSQHYKVFKGDINNMALTSIKKLNFNDRIHEIARMLSGDEVNEEAIANAKKMIDI